MTLLYSGVELLDGLMSVFGVLLMAFAWILERDGDRRWIGMGEVDDRTGKMQIFALSFVKSVSESSIRHLS